MQLNIKKRLILFFTLTAISLSASLLITHLRATAQTPVNQKVQLATNPSQLFTVEQQGKNSYTQGNWKDAIAFWQQAANNYANQKDLISQGRVLSNLALAYQKIGDWQQAEQSIERSLKLLNQISPDSAEKERLSAQIFNNQGILKLEQGKPEEAIASYQQATKIYQQLDDRSGVIRGTINQANAFKALGLYRRAVKTLESINQTLAEQPTSLIKAVSLRSYGDILRLVGDLTRAKQAITESLTIATELKSSEDIAKAQFSLGNILWANHNAQSALEKYYQALTICQESVCRNSNLPLQINLAQFNLLLETKSWQRTQELISEIQINLNNLSLNQSNIYKQISFANSLIKLKQKANKNKINITTKQTIEQLLENAIQKAQKLGSSRAESYAVGLLGQIAEQEQQLSKAESLTTQALMTSQTVNAPEISYLWQWQLGRILQAQGDREKAISYYTQSVNLLKTLSQDLVAVDPDVQYSFRESVEPVYRDLVSLLLESSPATELTQANLVQARDTIESLQLAELHNFFREACLDAKPVKIDQLDRSSAVIYPIILGDRLEIIVSIPQQPLYHYSTDINQIELEAVIEQMRQTIVIRSKRDFYAPARQLYDWLIRPALSQLLKNQIKTIVFVPDGALRNIPMSALFDGKQYLIEQYDVALTPGLQLLAPRPLQQLNLKTLAAGLTQKRQGFAALEYVNLELKEIKDQIKTTVLLNENFTEETLQQEIKFSNFPIVHIATHGQFSSTLDETFLLAWNKRIDINTLDSILKTRTPSQQQAIELLVLSACETAIGDKWAALGLAGMAVRAGARSTLATLWSVNDRATAELMGQFYRELSKKDITKAEAVRQAQLALIHHNSYRHPFYWSPYILVGNWL